jgi:hypothetical protein
MGEQIIALYEETFLQLGATPKIIFEMENEKVNAYARRPDENPNEWQIVFTGGLLRHKRFSDNAFKVIFCHEIGHHLGGLPIKQTSTWASAEGQSDYFASNDCLYKLFKNDQIKSTFVHNKCSGIYDDPAEIQLCSKVAEASFEAIRFSQKMKRGRRPGRQTPVKLTKRDKTKVTVTNLKHPAAQCRLDTLFEGALCEKTFDEYGLSNNCKTTKSPYQGSRPLCWFTSSKKQW